MSLALHGHHVLLIATLVFLTAVLTPNWYTNSNKTTDINVFQICSNSSTSNKTCRWIFSLLSDKSFFEPIRLGYPVASASLAIVCLGISLIGLLLSSWYVQRYALDNDSLWLIVLTMLAIFLSFLLSCGVWVIMLTTNLQQVFGMPDVHLKNFGFSFWLNIGSSVVYLYTLIIYLITICKG